MAFDKRRFLDNVYYLAKLRDIKIGVLEVHTALKLSASAGEIEQ